MSGEARFDAQEILSGLKDWVEIESPSSDPEATNRMVARVATEFAALGAKTERLAGPEGYGDCLKVRTQWGGDGPGIMVICHLDTVHPIGFLERLPYHVDGDKAYGPGIYDMKSGAYIALHAYRELCRLGKESKLPITFFFNTDEELSSVTSRDPIMEEAKKHKYVLIAEPSSDLGKVITNRKGTARFNMSITGVAAHSGGNHEKGRSAIKELAHQILFLESLTDYDKALTVNVGEITGGTRANVVPEFATALVDMRVPTKVLADEYIAKVLNIAANDPDVSIKIEGGAQRPPFEQSDASLALCDKIAALAKEIGFELYGGRGGGASDGNFTSLFTPTIDGLGIIGEGAHTDHEHILISSIEPRARLMYRMFETLA